MNLSNIRAPKKATEKRKRVGLRHGQDVDAWAQGAAFADRLAHDSRV
jgi:hypothetical protein